MTKKLLAVSLLALCSLSAMAQTLYVKDVIYITLRDGPGNQYSPIRTLQSGATMTQLEVSPDEKFIKVTTKNGDTGWVPAQYVTDEAVASAKLEDAETRLAALKGQNTALTTQIADLKKELTTVRDSLSKLDATHSKLDKEYARVREINKGPIELTRENDELRNQTVAMEKEMQRLQQEVQVMDDRNEREWFMIGAGVLGLGMVLGLVLPFFTRRKRRDNWSSL